MQTIKCTIAVLAIILANVTMVAGWQLLGSDQTHNFYLGLACILWFLYIVPTLSLWLYLEFQRIRPFTLIELLAVITITSILLTIFFRFMKTDPQKSEAVRIAGDLRLLHSASFIYDEDDGYVRKFELDSSRYSSTVTESHDDFSFEKGEPSIPVVYTLTLEYKNLEPMKIYVRPFTGKVTFYEP